MGEAGKLQVSGFGGAWFGAYEDRWAWLCQQVCSLKCRLLVFGITSWALSLGFRVAIWSRLNDALELAA